MLKLKREPLTDENFLLMAARWYDRGNCVMTEFEHDLHRIKYVKKLFRKYKKTGEIRERLILNHIIILGNVFGVEHSIRMLYLKIAVEDWDVLKTFLISIEQNPSVVHNINGKDIITTGIRVDMNIADRLRKIPNE
jgi:uncharacterized membrane protein YbaN (DUF454 family)